MTGQQLSLSTEPGWQYFDRLERGVLISALGEAGAEDESTIETMENVLSNRHTKKGGPGG